MALGLLGALTLVIATIAFGLCMSRPASTAVGLPPSELHAEDVAIFSASGAVLRVDLETYAPEEYRRRVLPFLVDNLQQKS